MTINILIVDDNPKDISLLKSTLDKVAAKMNESLEYTTYENIDEIDFEPYYDMYFLDIDMPKSNGFELARNIYHYHSDGIMIFFSNHNNLVFDAFKLNTFFFVRKDHLNEDIQEVITKFLEIHKTNQNVYLYHGANKYITMSLHDIYYFEINGNNLFVHTELIEYKEKKSLKKLLKELPNGLFVRIDRNFIINIMHISKIDCNLLYLKNGIKFKISRRNLEEVRKMYIHFLRG